MPLRPFGFAVDAAIREHALAAYPNEACGLVVNGSYVPLENIAANPRDEFEIAPVEMLREGIQAIVHSHPDQAPWPSADDMRQQMATGLLWGLVSTDGTDATGILWWGPGIETPPLVGRDFRHGPSGSDGKGDCYALIKDWYAVELGVELVEGPRSHEWWRAGGDLYRENFAAAGFRVVSIEGARRGDVLLMQIQSQVANHAAIVLGNGLILHHLSNRLSREEPLSRWLSFVTHALRHESQA
jgi:cell wall-associated NlpC family hydrolase